MCDVIGGLGEPRVAVIRMAPAHDRPLPPREVVERKLHAMMEGRTLCTPMYRQLQA